MINSCHAGLTPLQYPNLQSQQIRVSLHPSNLARLQAGSESNNRRAPMFTVEQLEEFLNSKVADFAQRQLVRPWLPAISKLLNQSALVEQNFDDYDVQSMLQTLGFALKEANRTGKPMGASELKKVILGSLGIANLPAQMNSFSLESPTTPLSQSALEQSTTLHQTLQLERSDVARLRLTTPAAQRNGRALAAAALKLINKIRWLPRGKEVILGASLLSKADKVATDSRRGVNQFWQWLQGGFEFKEGVMEIRMNCWEAVFYTAYKAGLTSRGELRMLFSAATDQARTSFGDANLLKAARDSWTPGSNLPSWFKDGETAMGGGYLPVLFKRLKRDAAVTINRREDTPKRGDLVFLDGMAHVCICVGKLGENVTHVASLWHHADEHYTVMPFEVLLEGFTGGVSIHPCPF